MSNAAGHLRTNESSCPSEVFGIDSLAPGKHGKTPMGDLSTIVCSYDHTAGYSSNSLSSYFHDFGWRQRLHDLVNEGSWLGNYGTGIVLHVHFSCNLLAGDSLGGNYGESTPSDLGFTLTSPNEESQNICKADKDPWPAIYDNALTALTEVEMTRRVAMFKDVLHIDIIVVPVFT